MIFPAGCPLSPTNCQKNLSRYVHGSDLLLKLPGVSLTNTSMRWSIYSGRTDDSNGHCATATQQFSSCFSIVRIVQLDWWSQVTILRSLPLATLATIVSLTSYSLRSVITLTRSDEGGAMIRKGSDATNNELPTGFPFSTTLKV